MKYMQHTSETSETIKARACNIRSQQNLVGRHYYRLTNHKQFVEPITSAFRSRQYAVGGDDILITGGLQPAVIIAYHSWFVLPAGSDLNFQNSQK